MRKRESGKEGRKADEGIRGRGGGKEKAKGGGGGGGREEEGRHRTLLAATPWLLHEGLGTRHSPMLGPLNSQWGRGVHVWALLGLRLPPCPIPFRPV